MMKTWVYTCLRVDMDYSWYCVLSILHCHFSKNILFRPSSPQLSTPLTECWSDTFWHSDIAELSRSRKIMWEGYCISKGHRSRGMSCWLLGDSQLLSWTVWSLPGAAGNLKGHQPGGVEEEGVQVFSVDGAMEWWLRVTPFDFWQKVLYLLNGHQDLTKDREDYWKTAHLENIPFIFEILSSWIGRNVQQWSQN